jgi:hypothetical protein
MGVTLTESIMGSIPVGLALWYFDVASLAGILEFLVLLVAAVSLSISIYAHVRPAPYTRSIHREGAL